MSRPPMPVGTWGAIHYSEAGPGKWNARTRVRDNDGRTREVMRSGKTKGAARNRLLEHLKTRATPSQGDVRAEARLGDLMDAWHAAPGKTWSINTRRRYREVIDLHVTPGIGGLRVREATVGLLDGFLQGLAVDVGPPTAKLAKSVLTGALGLAVRHGALNTNPMRDTSPITVEKRAPKALGADHVGMFRSALRERENPKPGSGRPITPGLAALVDVLLGTGIRIGEGLALRWPDFNPLAGTLEVTGTVVKSEDGPWIRQETTKTDASTRTLYLPQFTIDALLRHRELLPPTTEDLIFPSAAGTVRDPGNVRKTWRTVAKQVGLPPGTTPHTLRRTVATLLDGASGTRAAASQLGHTDEATTRRHYVERSSQGPQVAEILQSLAG